MSKPNKVHRGDSDNTLDVKRTYTLLIDLEEIDPEYKDDEVTLQSDDDEYKQTLVLGEDGEEIDERWIKITFTRILPDKTYTCMHDLKRTSTGVTCTIPLFRSVPLEMIHLNKPGQVDESLPPSEEKKTEEEKKIESEILIGLEEEDEKEIFDILPQIGEGIFEEEDDDEDDNEDTGDDNEENTEKSVPVSTKDLDEDDLWITEDDEDSDKGWLPEDSEQKVRDEEDKYPYDTANNDQNM
ncbi:MAG: hypothetical protein JW860_16505 [Sedimentisphaerales bacterium]|nr:hypothetical protein [Sedimentisphaerales bacterium]